MKTAARAVLALGVMIAAGPVRSEVAPRMTLRVVGMAPAPGATMSTAPTAIDIGLSGPPDPATINPASVVLTRAGADGVLSTADDVPITPTSISLLSATVVHIDVSGVALPEDLYRVLLRGADAPISGLVSHWKLDEGAGTTTADSSGSGYAGTLGGTTLPTWTTGRIGSALSFDGADNRVTTSAPDVSRPWTAAMWVKRLDSSSVDARLLDSVSYPSGTSLRLEQYNDTNRVGFTQYGSADYAFSYTAPIDAWVHLTFVGTTGGTSLYVNGALTATHSASIDLSRYNLGSHGYNTLRGTLDDVRIYDRALSASEIAALAALPDSVRDPTGAVLDGEFSGAFPSGDGVAGGDFMATFRVLGPPGAPSALVATRVAFDRVDLTWQDNASNESGFEIERGTDGVSFSLFATAPPNATAYTDFSSALLYYRVRAVNAAGASAYSNVAATVLGPPAAPSSLVARRVSEARVELTWQDNSTIESAFEVERSSDGTVFGTVATPGVNSTAYSDTNTGSSGVLYYRVRAANATEPSAYSNVARVSQALTVSAGCGASEVPAHGVLVIGLVGWILLALAARRPG